MEYLDFFFHATCVTDWKIIQQLMYSPGSKFIILTLAKSNLFPQSSAMLACKFRARHLSCRRHMKNWTVDRKYTQVELYLITLYSGIHKLIKLVRCYYLIFNMALCTYTGFPSIINVKSLVSWRKKSKSWKEKGIVWQRSSTFCIAKFFKHLSTTNYNRPLPQTLTFKMRLGTQPFLWKWVLFAWE